MHNKILVKYPHGKSSSLHHLRDLDVCGKILLKCILKKDIIVRTGLKRSSTKAVTDSCKHGNELSGFIKADEIC
jgi:hypothetical protein